MGEVRVGTEVIGADGKACKVTRVYNRGIKDVYRVYMNDNTYVECGLEHLWEIEDENIRRVMSLKQIMEEKERAGKNWWDYKIRLVKPIPYNYKGDSFGLKYGKKIILREIWRQQQKQEGMEENKYQEEKMKKNKRYGWNVRHSLRGRFTLWYEAEEDRNIMAETVRQNGGFARINEDGTVYIDFRPSARKAIVGVEKVRQERCRCIKVDSPEHLYVTDGYTLTHNTEIGKRFMSFAIGKDPELPNMMVSYSASIAKDKFYNGELGLIEDDNKNFANIFPKTHLIYKNAETLSLDFTNTNRKKPHSEYTLYCAGFDGGITGRTRAWNVLYLDDLVKNMEAANNKDVMDKMVEEFNSTLRKRMQGNCKMLMIGTIFSINDPFSRTIEFYRERDPKRIEIIKIPRFKRR